MSEGLPYRPSNATEGDIFFAAWCASCRWWDREDGCPTHGVAMRFDTYDDEYPLEWRYIDNRPACTGYQFSDDDQEAPTPRCLKTPDMFEVLG